MFDKLCKINTDEQVTLLENVWNGMNEDEQCALVNFGGEMYQRGIIRGALTIFGVAVFIGTVDVIKEVVKYRKFTKERKKRIRRTKTMQRRVVKNDWF